MCELTFINTNELKVNRLLLINTLMENARSGHKDGTGFFSDGNTLFKTELDAKIINDLGKISLEKVTSLKPIIAHVRLASVGQKVISAEKAHPFETSKLVLAHNGTLELGKKFESNKAEYKDMIDSEIFLSKLDEKYDGTNLVEALEKTMEEFTGKFAFLVYSKIEDKFFVIRGKIAELYKADLTYQGREIGYIINTDEDDLLYTLCRVKNLLALEGKELDWKDITLLEAEKIFYAKSRKELVEIKDIKENTKTYPVVYSGYSRPSLREPSFEDNIKDMEEKYSEIIVGFLRFSLLSVREFEEICESIYNCGMTGLLPAELEHLTHDVIPALVNRCNDHKFLKQSWKLIKEKSNELGIDPYKEFNMQFPYMLNSKNDVDVNKIYTKLSIKKADLYKEKKGAHTN